MNNILGLLIQVGVMGFVCYLILLIPMPPRIQNIVIGIMCLIIILYALNFLGFAGHAPILK